MKSRFLRTPYKPLHDKAQACLSKWRRLFLLHPVLELQWPHTTSHTGALVSVIPQHPTWRIPNASPKMLLRPSCPCGVLGDLVKGILRPSLRRSRTGPEVLLCTSNNSQVMLRLLETYVDKTQKHDCVSPPCVQNPSPTKLTRTNLPLS